MKDKDLFKYKLFGTTFPITMKFMITYQLTALRKVSGPLTVMKMDLQDLDF